jgi:hypothetical protein
MTICIAALCENRSKIILAADRMITVGQILEFEHEVRKFKELTSNCVIMYAGSATIQDDIINEAMPQIQNLRTPVFKQITNEIIEAYTKIRIRKTEETILKPQRLDFDSFYQSQRMLLPEIVFNLTNAITNMKLGVEYILCGFDNTFGHINYIVDPGTSECFDSVGFCAMGTGNLNAVSVFTAHKYAPSFSVDKALYLTFLAKREAERSPGVGKETDIAILSSDCVKHLSNHEIGEIEKIYTDCLKIEEKEYKEVKDKIINKWNVENATNTG